MSEYMLGVSRIKRSDALCRKADKIAARHGCSLVWGKFPGIGWQRWFAGPNRGNPFDRDMSDAVYADLERELPEFIDQ